MGMHSMGVSLGNGMAIGPQLGSGSEMGIMKYICMYYTVGSELQHALVSIQFHWHTCSLTAQTEAEDKGSMSCIPADSPVLLLYQLLRNISCSNSAVLRACSLGTCFEIQAAKVAGRAAMMGACGAPK